ncbi:MAG: substrate-binding domain-containing protein [Pseudomonadota bacterium]|nr:substrate-binding domain-containing protein [Pseudomonadota bacterium]
MNLKNLSDLLGLSQTTVSRALNDYPEVSEKTRQKVLKAARDNNYSANPTARNLATGRSGAIGHVIPFGTHKMINPHFSDFIAGVGSTYSKIGLDIVMSISDSNSEMESYKRLAQSRRVDGFVLHGPLVNDERIKMLRELQLPFVAHGRCFGIENSDQETDYSWLDVDNLGAFDQATTYLLDLGHKNIALLNGLEHMNFAYLRRRGFERAMERANIKTNPTFMISSDMTEFYGYKAAIELLSTKRSRRPSAILTASRIIAEGVQRAIKDCSLKTPSDISLMTYDDELGFLPNNEYNSDITCMRSSIYQAGIRVGQMIGELLISPEKNPICELWMPKLVEGKSTGSVPKN